MLVSRFLVPSYSDFNVSLGRTICHFVRAPPCRHFTWFSSMTRAPVRSFYYGLGTQIYCAPTVDARPEWQHTMIHIALEGRCFVLAACQFAQEKHYPQDHPVRDSTAREAENVMIAGGSVIVSPLGKVLAGPLLGKEGILSATIDLNDCVRGKFDLDVAGHYARPDGECLRDFCLGNSI